MRLQGRADWHPSERRVGFATLEHDGMGNIVPRESRMSAMIGAHARWLHSVMLSRHGGEESRCYAWTVEQGRYVDSSALPRLSPAGVLEFLTSP